MHIKNDHAGNFTRNDANMNSPNAVSIVLLATLFALTINNSNGVDPRSLWSFIKQTAANGNQYFSNWLNYIFGSSSEQQDMNLITSTIKLQKKN
ncbi:hypothetical protein V1477_020343 [Vespula maculifrons]|uniref:Uncharacterized protein n=1 Tax=Vespula maculifrons TaxID=7453 RepID=A0ABD2ALN1_VESMC